MKLLAIDASGLAGSVAYYKDNQLVGEYYMCHKLTHSETIMPMMEHLKDLLEIELESLDAIVVSSGPGSFTGLRIGVSTAKAMAMALGKPIIGIPTLDLLAAQVTHTPYLICPIMDARRNQVYTATYQWEGEQLKQILEHQACDMNELLETLKHQTNDVLFVGDGIVPFKPLIEEVLGERAHFAPSFLCMQRASVLAHIGALKFEKGEVEDPNHFAPIYLRKSQAEREREERLKNEH